jgi:hypothetical protein
MRTFAALAFCALTIVTIAFSSSAQTPSPITINSCGPILRQQQTFVWQSPPPSFMGVPISSTSSGMGITFVNESNRVATLVNFDVNDNGNRFVIRDVGTFSPGVTIDHQYKNGSGQSYILPAFITPHVQCRVASVTFADGSIWRHGHPAAPPAGYVPGPGPGYGYGARLAATPRQLVIDTSEDSALFLVQSSAPVAGFREHDNCDGIANVYVASTADTAATYAVRPLASGSCRATVRDESGASTTIPITVR